MAEVKVSAENITPSKFSELCSIQKHKKQLFGMFTGEECTVTFEADNSLIDTVLDKFGFDTRLSARGENTFRFSATVQLSPVFLGWCCSLGDKLRVIGPNNFIDLLRHYIANVVQCYSN